MRLGEVSSILFAMDRIKQKSTWVLATVILLLGGWLLQGNVSAAAITVNTTADELNQDGDCSLREAIRAAKLDEAVDGCPAGNSADTIYLPAGHYTFALDGAGENSAATGDLDIDEDLTILGAGKGNTTIDADGRDRVFEISSATVEISGVTITGGDSGGDPGGGIFVPSGTLTLAKSRITGNVGRAGIYSHSGGTIKVIDSRIDSNSSSAGGGGISSYGIVHLFNSLVSGNTTEGDGGGLWNQGTLLLVNSTISGNSANEDGGAIINAASGTVVVYNATITENTADFNENDSGDGGGVYNLGDFDFRNSIIGDNFDPSNAGPQYPDCYGTLFGYGYNLIENMAGCTITGSAAGNVTGVSPGLGPLANNGGPTLTHRLLAGSPAVDAGSPGGCPSNIAGVDLTTDQRGFVRPVDGNSDGVAECDMGAFERLSLGAPTATPSPTATVTPEVTPTATASATPDPAQKFIYLPIIVR